MSSLGDVLAPGLGDLGSLDSESLDPLGVFGGKSSREATEAQLQMSAEGIAEQFRQFDIC